MQCVAGAPCVLSIAAAAYSAARGSFLNASGYCDWGPAAGGNRSSRCADGPLLAAAAVSIDAQHAGTRTCGGALYPGAGTGQARALNTPRCHAVGAQTAAGGVANLSVTVFGGRAGQPQPYEFDIGSKLILCFQVFLPPRATRSLSLTHTFSLILSVTLLFTLSASHYLCRSLSICISLSLSLSVSLSLSLAVSLSLSLSLFSLTLSLTLSLSLSASHCLCLSVSIYRFLSPSLPS